MTDFFELIFIMISSAFIGLVPIGFIIFLSSKEFKKKVTAKMIVFAYMIVFGLHLMMRVKPMPFEPIHPFSIWIIVFVILYFMAGIYDDSKEE